MGLKCHEKAHNCQACRGSSFLVVSHSEGSKTPKPQNPGPRWGGSKVENGVRVEGTCDSVPGPTQKTMWWLRSRFLLLCLSPEPVSPPSRHLSSWKEYYEWRSIPLDSPVALLLHWPLTIYHASKTGLGSRISEIGQKLHIHYLGPEKELLQLAVFAELHALFPGFDVHVELVGPAVPQHRDGERITLCKYARCLGTDCICKSIQDGEWGIQTSKSTTLALNLRNGFYHNRYGDIVKDSFPHLIIAPNAGIAAYPSWSPTIELIKEISVPAVFTDYCEEACNLGASSITSITGRPLSFPIQLNPFRQPMVVEDSALFLPCYSNCYLYGIESSDGVAIYEGRRRSSTIVSSKNSDLENSFPVSQGVR
ncbi:hypothetical protein TorRG33x02_304470 [Trema orientale]|uniref:Mitochondrial splicing suppressor 51-like C-terminal domain-containing protein n=1 Tax=Trema orientale TaxID=63057 RepID=A0A2P5BYB5_TREOI|nr:hypothetical protein TorRG33x02_304470 [Trema orientale]